MAHDQSCDVGREVVGVRAHSQRKGRKKIHHRGAENTEKKEPLPLAPSQRMGRKNVAFADSDHGTRAEETGGMPDPPELQHLLPEADIVPLVKLRADFAKGADLDESHGFMKFH